MIIKCLFVCLFVCFVCFVCLLICLFACLFVCLFEMNETPRKMPDTLWTPRPYRELCQNKTPRHVPLCQNETPRRMPETQLSLSTYRGEEIQISFDANTQLKRDGNIKIC